LTTKTKRLFFLFVLLLICCLPGLKINAAEFTNSLAEPLHITSDKLEADKKKGTIIFTGNVIAQQADGTIMSDLLVVKYGDDKKLNHIVATGDVRINTKGTVGTSRKATYFPDEKKVLMEGNPRIWKEGDMITGDMITVFMDSDRVLVEGAKATIYQEKVRPEDDGP